MIQHSRGLFLALLIVLLLNELWSLKFLCDSYPSWVKLLNSVEASFCLDQSPGLSSLSRSPFLLASCVLRSLKDLMCIRHQAP